MVNMMEVLSGLDESGRLRLPDVSLDRDSIRALMINEVVPKDPDDDFYGKSPAPSYLSTTIPLFQDAGVKVGSIGDVLSLGVYVTNAVKSPKDGYEVEKEALLESLPLLEREFDCFSNLRVVVLMGDVAKKAFNMIVKKRLGKNVIPSGSTYKIRKQQFFYGDVRVMPSYIMTGGNILIEKSKAQMVAEDIGEMMRIIGKV